MAILLNLVKWGRLTQVEWCHITYNTQNTTILVIFLMRMFENDII